MARRVSERSVNRHLEQLAALDQEVRTGCCLQVVESIRSMLMDHKLPPMVRLKAKLIQVDALIGCGRPGEAWVQAVAAGKYLRQHRLYSMRKTMDDLTERARLAADAGRDIGSVGI